MSIIFLLNRAIPLKFCLVLLTKVPQDLSFRITVALRSARTTHTRVQYTRISAHAAKAVVHPDIYSTYNHVHSYSGNRPSLIIFAVG